MPAPGKVQVTSTLEGDLAIDFRALEIASMASKSSLVRQAVRLLIDSVIKENGGLRERYNVERLKLMAPKRRHLSVIK